MLAIVCAFSTSAAVAAASENTSIDFVRVSSGNMPLRPMPAWVGQMRCAGTQYAVMKWIEK